MAGASLEALYPIVCWMPIVKVREHNRVMNKAVWSQWGEPLRQQGTAGTVDSPN